MDSVGWKINGEPVADIGLEQLRLTRVSQQADKLVFNAPGEDFDGDELWSYGEALSLFKDEACWFSGRVLATPRTGSPRSERHDYTVAGPWWWLENLTFEQEWRAGLTGDTLNKSHVILGRDIEDDPVTTGAVIAEVLAYCIDQGAPLSYAAAELAILDAEPPADEQIDLACSEAITKMLRWHPDVTTWFDYDQPVPVLHFTRRKDAAAIDYACMADPAEEIAITRRDELMRSGVIINYERIDTVDGEHIPALHQDIYPVGTAAGFDVVTLTIQLAGSELRTQSTEVVVEEDKIKLIEAARPELVGAKYEQDEYGSDIVTITQGSLPRVFMEGVLPTWTNKKTEAGEYYVYATWEDPETGTIHTHEKVSLQVTLTDAETHKYTREISYTEPEATPTGLAQRLYEALSVPHFEGRWQVVEEECSAGPHPGRVLNLTGGRAEWSSMRAVIQQVAFDLDAGRTMMLFGPPEHLSPQDYVNLLNANRSRITRYSGNSRTTGRAVGGEELDTGGTTPTANNGGVQGISKFVVRTVEEKDGNGETTKKPNKIIIDAEELEPRQLLITKKERDETTQTLETEWINMPVPEVPDAAVSNWYLCLKKADCPSLKIEEAVVWKMAKDDDGNETDEPEWYLQWDYLRGVATPVEEGGA